MTDRVQTASAAEELAGRILAPRPRPLVVLSTDPGTGAVVLDLDELLREVGDLADVAIITTGEPTHALSAALPDRAQVYGGAGRSYPADFGREPDWRRSPLRFPGQKATQNLAADVLGQANAAGLFVKPPQRSAVVSGTVEGFVADGSRAVVTVTGHGLATVSRELTFPPFPLDWTLAKRQRVTGVLDLESKRLLVEAVVPTIGELASRYPHGSVTLAYVEEVTPTAARLRLHPSVAPIVIRATDVSPNPLDTVDLLLAEGDVVAARVVHLMEGLHLRLVDVDDDEEVLPAVAVTTGGPAWLIEGRALVLEPDAPDAPDALPVDLSAPVGETDDVAVAPAVEEDEPAADDVVRRAPLAPAGAPLPGPGRRPAAARVPEPVEAVPAAAPATPVGPALRGVQLELAAAQSRIRLLEQQLVAAGADDSSLRRLQETKSGAEARMREALADLGTANRRILELEGERRQSTRTLREARRATPAGQTRESREARRARWASAEEWVRHEVYLAWVERVSATERADWPLGEYVVGPRFSESLADLDDGQFDKSMRAVVDAVTGRIGEVAGREQHPLRTGDGAAAPQYVRASDGARCWRAYIEHRTAAARRLHYWTLPGGVVELSRIVVHDDVEP